MTDGSTFCALGSPFHVGEDFGDDRPFADAARVGGAITLTMAPAGADVHVDFHFGGTVVPCAHF